MLQVDNVAFAYDDRHPVLHDVSFSVAAGEVVAIVGRNGAGKSTLLRLLNGLKAPHRGSVIVDGCSTVTTPIHVLARHIGTVFQAPEQQMFHASVRDEIAFGVRQLGITGGALTARVDATLDRVGLRAVAGVHPLDLDQAGRRFVALGSVIAMEPPILLLDEPQRGLDRAAVMRLESIIADHVHAGGAALIVCHDMEFVARRASRVLAVAGGRIVADRSTLDFFAAPEHAQAAGVEPPDTIALARLLALAPSLTPAAFAAAWLAAWR